jgi:hypothetical protein
LASYFIALLQTRNITLNQNLSQVVPQMLLWPPGSHPSITMRPNHGDSWRFMAMMQPVR